MVLAAILPILSGKARLLTWTAANKSGLSRTFVERICKVSVNSAF